MDFDRADQRERHDLVVACFVDSDHAVLGIHFRGDVMQPVDALTEIGGDAIDRLHMIDLVYVHDQAARAETVGSCFAQFHGSSS